MPLTFVHLSDIHIRGYEMDLDEEIRRELLLDVQEWRGETGAPDGILVTGDVAFSGQESQYETARTWLRRLADEAGCHPEDVWVVPGNHDVDWSVIEHNELLQMTQHRVRGHNPNDRDAVNHAVRKVCRDGGMSGLLLTPLDRFNALCRHLRGRLLYEHRRARLEARPPLRGRLHPPALGHQLRPRVGR